MSRDLRTLLHEAAPRPAHGLDEREVARRARRITATRAVAAVGVAVAVLGGGLVAASVRPPRHEGIVGDPRPRPAPPQPEVDVRHRKPRIPAGPRYEIASGVFGDDWDHYPGRTWRLLVWGEPTETCWQLAVEGEARNSNAGCTHDRDPEDAAEEVFGGSSSSETGGSDPEEFAFVSGEVGPSVARLEFSADGGPGLSIPLYAAPLRTGIVHRYYAAVLPRYDYGRMVALSRDDEVLSAKNLCGIGCRAEREREDAIEVLTYEHTPVTAESAAAAFAVEAAARAGLVDQFATMWSYRTISSDDLVATFWTTECHRDAPASGPRCDPDQGTGAIDVGIEDGRFVVEGVEGTATDAQWAAVESYSAPVTDDVREWRHVAHSFARAGGREWEVNVVAVWTGNLGAPRDYGSLCRLTFYDEAGDVIRRSHDLPFWVRTDEHGRVSALLTTVTTKRSPADVTMRCTEPGPFPNP